MMLLESMRIKYLMSMLRLEKETNMVLIYVKHQCRPFLTIQLRLKQQEESPLTLQLQLTLIQISLLQQLQLL